MNPFKPFDEMQEAEIRNDFRRMYRDLGLKESMIVFTELIATTEILSEVLEEELLNEFKEKGKKEME